MERLFGCLMEIYSREELIYLLLLWEALESSHATRVIGTVHLLATYCLIWIILAHWMDFRISFVKWTNKLQISDLTRVIYYCIRWCVVSWCCNEISDCQHCQNEVLVKFRVVVLDSNLMIFYSTIFIEVPCEWFKKFV